jgi:hypothetical protein
MHYYHQEGELISSSSSSICAGRDGPTVLHCCCSTLAARSAPSQSLAASASASCSQLPSWLSLAQHARALCPIGMATRSDCQSMGEHPLARWPMTVVRARR